MNNPSEISYQQAEGLDVHEADDGLIIFNPATDRVHHLNSSAGVLFELCSQSRSREDLLDWFNTLFGIDDSKDDTLQTVLDQLTKEGVLVETNGC